MAKVNINTYYRTALDLHKSGKLREARKLYADILRLKPNHLGSLFMTGQSWYQERNFEKALDYYNSGLKYQTGNTDLLLQKGKALIKLDRFEEAKTIFEQLVESNRDNPQVLFHGARGMKETGNFAQAIRLYEDVLLIDPSHIQALNNLGNLYQQVFNYDKSMDCYNRLLELNDQVAMAYCNKAGLLQKMGNLDEAEGFYHQALTQEPHNALASYNLGVISNRRYDFDQAIQWIRKSIESEPDNYKYLSTYATTLCSLQKKEEGKKILEKLIGTGTKSEDPYIRLARIFISENEYKKAIQLLEPYVEKNNYAYQGMYMLGILYDLEQDFEKAEIYLSKVDRHPELELKVNMTLQLLYSKLGRMDRYEEMMSRVSSLLQKFVQSNRVEDEIPVYNLAYYPFDPSLIAEVTKKFSQSLINSILPLRERHQFKYPTSKEKIKIGYLSPYYKKHPAGVLIQGVLKHHDKERFEIYGYAINGGLDNVNEEVRSLVDHYEELGNLSSANAAKKINSDGIHILVSLAGYNYGMKSEIAALRPAPVQVVCMDCHETMQTDFYDYVFKDESVLTKENRAFFSESIACLPSSHFFNAELSPSGKSLTKEEFGLPREGFVFGCLNHPRKVSPLALKYWIQILKNTPNAVLWLFDGGIEQFRQNVNKAFEKEGIEPDRIIFCGRINHADHVQRMELVDLYLDTPIYNGHTTCLEALWMEVPVLTITGNTVSSRLCSSFLAALDMSSLVASTENGYCKKAIELANSQMDIQELKDHLKSQKETNDFFQPKVLTSKIEDAYTQMWQNYLKGGRPTDFTIN